MLLLFWSNFIYQDNVIIANYGLIDYCWTSSEHYFSYILDV